MAPEMAPSKPILLMPPVDVRPPATMSDRLRAELVTLKQVPGFEAAVVSRRDGLVIHHTMKTAHEAASLCAMAAAMVGASGSAGAALERGGFVHAIIRYDDGILVVSEAGAEAVVACLLRPDANVGFLIMKIATVAENVMETLGEL